MHCEVVVIERQQRSLPKFQKCTGRVNNNNNNDEQICIARNKNPQSRSWNINRYCFSFCAYVPIGCALPLSHRSAGKLYHILAPATAKFRVPSLVFDPLTARQPDAVDRRCRRLAIDVTGTLSTVRYGGASRCRPSPPACTRCACELEVSGVHAGQV